MQKKKLDHLILQLENYLECWKQFSNYLGTARAKRFEPEDETQFLEVKSVMTQELEMILASIEGATPDKEDIHALIGGAPSLRYLSEQNEMVLRNLENQWHRLFIAWQAILGQLKAQQRQLDSQTVWSKLFSRKK